MLGGKLPELHFGQKGLQLTLVLMFDVHLLVLSAIHRFSMMFDPGTCEGLQNLSSRLFSAFFFFFFQMVFACFQNTME